MEIPEGIATLYLQLGIAGAILLILLIFIMLLFRFVTKDNGRVDKLYSELGIAIPALA